MNFCLKIINCLIPLTPQTIMNYFINPQHKYIYIYIIINRNKIFDLFSQCMTYETIKGEYYNTHIVFEIFDTIINNMQYLVVNTYPKPLIEINESFVDLLSYYNINISKDVLKYILSTSPLSSSEPSIMIVVNYINSQKEILLNSTTFDTNELKHFINQLNNYIQRHNDLLNTTTLHLFDIITRVYLYIYIYYY